MPNPTQAELEAAARILNGEAPPPRPAGEHEEEPAVRYLAAALEESMAMGWVQRKMLPGKVYATLLEGGCAKPRAQHYCAGVTSAVAQLQDAKKTNTILPTAYRAVAVAIVDSYVRPGA